jgi:hypothetical protein
MRPVRRRDAALVALPVLGLALAGCGSVQEQTQQPYDPTDGVSAEAGDIAIRNVLVVADEDGDAATVFASFANRGSDDRLVEVRVGDTDATPTGGSLDIPGGGYASLAPESTRLDIAGADTEPGGFVEIEFLFDDAPRVSVDAMVRPAEGGYENALIAPRATPSS